MKMHRYPKTVTLLILIMYISACSHDNLLDLEAAGPVTRTIDELIWITVSLMLLVLVPVFVMTAWFAWKYRASNVKATYAPNWDASTKIEWVVWLFPALIIVILATLTWISTHRLAPYQPLPSSAKPLEIQVIALDWKWLFIYPKQNVAAVNELAFPVNRPVDFRITSNTVMNSFFIPRLGGQIYAMAGMETQLYLMANKPGSYFGENTQYSGRGFPYQNFVARATTEQAFEAWVKKARRSQQKLDLEGFNQLARPSVRDPVCYYAAVEPGLFNQVIEKLTGGPMPQTANIPR